MNKVNVVILSAISSLALHAAEINQVIVRQQWPWSTDVKIEYVLSGVTKPVDITVKAYDGDVELSQWAVDAALSGDRYGLTSEGVGTITLDPVKAFGGSKVMMTNFKVKLSVADSPDNLDEVLYKVFSLTNSHEQVVELTRRDLLNGKYGSVVTDYGAIGSGFQTSLSDVLIWTGVTNSIKYKTTHLVMRKIPAKEYGIWTFGSPTTEYSRQTVQWEPPEDQHTVKLTENFYIGVFELTQAQYANVMSRVDTQLSAWPSSYTADDRDVHPVEQVSYQTLRSQYYVWPDQDPMHKIHTSNSLFLRPLRNWTGVEFDLPTSAQWEFACRAGTTTALSDGREYTSETQKAHTLELAWLGVNADTTMEVGLLKPNAYGLYDMQGNVSEFCVDLTADNIDVDGTGDPVVDPKGGKTGSTTSRVIRGGAFSNASGLGVLTCARSAFRYSRQENVNPNWVGCRVVCPENATW